MDVEEMLSPGIYKRYFRNVRHQMLRVVGQ